MASEHRTPSISFHIRFTCTKGLYLNFKYTGKRTRVDEARKRLVYEPRALSNVVGSIAVVSVVCTVLIGSKQQLRVSREGGVRGKSEHPHCGLLGGIPYLLTILTRSPYLRLTFGSYGCEGTEITRALSRPCGRCNITLPLGRGLCPFGLDEEV